MVSVFTVAVILVVQKRPITAVNLPRPTGDTEPPANICDRSTREPSEPNINLAPHPHTSCSSYGDT
jgi:hypothetical protein